MPAVSAKMGFGLAVGCAGAERRRSGGMRGAEPECSVARQGPDGSPAPMRAPSSRDERPRSEVERAGAK